MSEFARLERSDTCRGGVPDRTGGLGTAVVLMPVRGRSEKQEQPSAPAWQLCVPRRRLVMSHSSAHPMSFTCCSGCCLAVLLSPFPLSFCNPPLPALFLDCCLTVFYLPYHSLFVSPLPALFLDCQCQSPIQGLLWASLVTQMVRNPPTQARRPRFDP